MVDLDNDGFPDLFLVTGSVYPEVERQLPAYPYRTPAQAQEVTAQSSFYSANDRRLHFGLGASTSADLTIRWPNGATEKIPNLEADQLVVVREGAGIFRRDRLGRPPRSKPAPSG